jgi:HK97 family phage prohead protease
MLAPNQPTIASVFRPRTTIDPDGVVEGYASLFGEIDQARDMVMPGAFRRTLLERGVRRIPMLFQHDPSEPIGIWLELAEDHLGLRARGKLIPDVQRSREVFALVREGAIDGLSIGFRTVKYGLSPMLRSAAFVLFSKNRNGRSTAWRNSTTRGWNIAVNSICGRTPGSTAVCHATTELGQQTVL